MILTFISLLKSQIVSNSAILNRKKIEAWGAVRLKTVMYTMAFEKLKCVTRINSAHKWLLSIPSRNKIYG